MKGKYTDEIENLARRFQVELYSLQKRLESEYEGEDMAGCFLEKNFADTSAGNFPTTRLQENAHTSIPTSPAGLKEAQKPVDAGSAPMANY